MTIEEFWNRAFLACLTRLSAEEAKQEADKATQVCIEQWRNHQYSWIHRSLPWKDQPIGNCPDNPTRSSDAPTS